MRDWNGRSPFVRYRNNFKIQHHDGFIGCVVDCMAYVAGLVEAVPRTIDIGLIRLNVGKFATGYAANSRADMVMWSDIAADIIGDFGYPQFVSTIQFSQMARNDFFKFYLSVLAFAVNSSRLLRATCVAHENCKYNQRSCNQTDFHLCLSYIDFQH